MAGADSDLNPSKVRERLALYVVLVVLVLACVAVAGTVALMNWWTSELEVVPDGVRVLELQAADPVGPEPTTADGD